MVPDPNLRASDSDRDRTATLLREHHAAGRLDPDEFNERLDTALSARTIGELEALLADLPAIDLYRLPDAGLQRHPVVPGSGSHLAAMAAAGMVNREHGRLSPAWMAAWGSWAGVSGALVLIWVLAGMGYPWFAWVAGPWGIVMLARWISGGHPDGKG
jgi:Domain of unknown function (DUF1707)